MSEQQTKIHSLSTNRLEAFCDGVFAIAATLLVLEIKIPKHEEIALAGSLSHYLINLWPSYLMYSITFVLIGVYWSNHNWLFSFIRKTDHTANMIQVVFLMAISFLPFSTAILGDYISEPDSRQAAITLYAVGMFAPVVPIYVFFLYATQDWRLVDKNLAHDFIRRGRTKLGMSFLIALACIGLSIYYPITSVIVLTLLWIMYLLPPEKPVFDSNPA
jgi:uncharacterized membrane protein